MTDPKTTAHVKRLAQTIFDAAVANVGGGVGWRRLTEGCRVEQIALAGFNVIVGRYDPEDNPRPAIQDVIGANAEAMKLKLLARHG